MDFSPGLIKDVGRDVRGICTRPYLIGICGSLIYKALKKRLVSGAVLLGTLVYLGNRAFDFDIQGAYIAVGTFAVALTAFGAQKWAKWALNRSLLFAESHGANLLEHKKATRLKDLYLAKLYGNVYALEARVQYSAQALDEASALHYTLYHDLIRDRLARYLSVPEIRNLFIKVENNLGELPFDERSLDELVDTLTGARGNGTSLMLNGTMLDLGEYVLRSGQIMLSRLGFEAAVRYILGRTDRQRDERMDSGLDLSFIEDYLDGAPFHPNNTKVMEQASHGMIWQIDRTVGRRSLGERMYHSLRRFEQKKWHHHINTSLQASVGKLLHTISKRYGTQNLMAEDVLWRDESSRRLLHQNLLQEFAHTADPEEMAASIMSELELGAVRIYDRVFHDSPAEIERVVRREYGYSVQDSVRRRVRYDCEYAVNELDEKPMDDLELIGASNRTRRTMHNEMEQARTDLSLFRVLCSKTAFSEQWKGYTKETRRGLRIAFHTDHDGFRAEVLNAIEGKPNRASEIAGDLAEQFSPKASERIRRLRLHHCLAKFEYEDTIRQVIELTQLPPFQNHTTDRTPTTH